MDLGEGRGDEACSFRVSGGPRRHHPLFVQQCAQGVPGNSDANQVAAIFQREQPSSTTNLTGVLQAAFQEHFRTRKPTTVLVITDGEPNDKVSARREIISATQAMTNDSDLSVSFIQIGNDRSATVFLQELDDMLVPQGARFDIVDTINSAQLGTLSFDQLIQKSIAD